MGITNRTKTPWKVEEICDGKRFSINPIGVEFHALIDGSGRKDKYPDGVIYSIEQAKADAEFTVKAVNSHDELVEVMKEVGEAMTNIPGGYGYYIDRMREALAKAGVSVGW